MNFKGIMWNIKQKWEKIQKWFWNITNYYTWFDYIKSAKNIWIIGHDGIDWDSLGSVLAMQDWLKNKFTDKKISSYTSTKPSESFKFLEPDIKYWEDLKVDEDTDLLIFLDCASIQRAWKLYEDNKEIIERVDKINIDHHIDNTKFWTINILDPDAPAAAEVVFNFFKALEWRVNNLINSTHKGIDEKVANYLLLGIITDTNIFSTQNSWINTLKVASELIEMWADKNYLIEEFYQNKSLESFKLEAIILSRAEKINQKWVKFAYSFVEKKDLENAWIDESDFSTKGLVSSLKEIKDTEFVCMAKILKWRTYVSFRSKKYDVRSLAEKLWWWWHINAAACAIEWDFSPEEIKAKVQNIIFS